MSEPLDEQAVADALAGLDGWSGDRGGLRCEWRFKDFPSAIAFMSGAVDGIEARNHHPEWSNVYNRVSVRLATHDAGDLVTAKDVDLARFLNERAQAALG